MYLDRPGRDSLSDVSSTDVLGRGRAYLTVLRGKYGLWRFRRIGASGLIAHKHVLILLILFIITSTHENHQSHQHHLIFSMLNQS